MKKIGNLIKISFAFIVCTEASVAAFGQKLKAGADAPLFTTTLIGAKTIQLSDFRGKILLLDFWASWCAPCLENNEELIDIYKKYRSSGFEIFAISLDEKKENAEKVIAHYPWHLHAWEPSSFDSGLAIKYNINAIPCAFLIDTEGKILLVNPDAYDVEMKLKKIFKK